MELATPDSWAWPNGALIWAKEGAQSVVDFYQSLLGSAGTICVGARQSAGGPCGALWEICMPEYQATALDILEERRLNMGLALFGQLSVVTCRLLTGHLGGAAVGLCVFVVGNRARCSLHSGSITAYVVLGGALGAADAVGLLQEMLSYGTSFVAFPVSDNIVRDLSAVSMVLAPVVEGIGARIAWDSYLDPTMLFVNANGAGSVSRGPSPLTIQARMAEMQRVPAQMPLHYGGAPYYHRPGMGWSPQPPYGSYYYPPAHQHHGTLPEDQCFSPGGRRPTGAGREGGGFWSPFSWWPSSPGPSTDANVGGHVTPCPPSRASSDAGSAWGHRSPEAIVAPHAHGASSRDAPYGRLSSAASDLCSEPDGSCAQCGDQVPGGKGWRGSGAYYDKVYCRGCWVGWSTGWR